MATQVLGRWLPGHTELLPVIAALAEPDRDAELRTYAAGLVAQPQQKQAG